MRELPHIEALYKQYVKEGKSDEAAALLTDYQRDFFGAAVLRWDELGNRLWKDNWTGF